MPRVDDVVVVEHQHDIVGDALEIVEETGNDRFDRLLRRLQERDCICANPYAVLSAVTTYIQNNAGSLSRWSSETHAAARPLDARPASQSASSVVLPNPAGADTSISSDSAPRLRRSLSLARATRSRRRLGTRSLVSSSGPAMTTSPQGPASRPLETIRSRLIPPYGARLENGVVRAARGRRPGLMLRRGERGCGGVAP